MKLGTALCTTAQQRQWAVAEWSTEWCPVISAGSACAVLRALERPSVLTTPMYRPAPLPASTKSRFTMALAAHCAIWGIAVL